jgi:hypothetical protein
LRTVTSCMEGWKYDYSKVIVVPIMTGRIFSQAQHLNYNV